MDMLLIFDVLSIVLSNSKPVKVCSMSTAPWTDTKHVEVRERVIRVRVSVVAMVS
jgi:hypothetical protein